MKFGFVTCVQLGKSCMEAIYNVGGHLDLIITLEDNQAINKSGRVYLDEFCYAHNIPLIKSSHVNNEECIQAVKDYKIDYLFIIGWSQIANNLILSAPTKGVLGIHPTLLPQGRGRASIPWAILKDLTQTGVTLFKLDKGVDTGDILEQLIIPLSKSTTATELYELVNQAHIDLITTLYPKLQEDKITFNVQNNELATTWPGRGPDDGKIDLGGSIFQAEKLIRAVTRPYPGAYAIIGNQKLIIWESEIQSADYLGSDKKLTFSDGILLLKAYEEVKATRK